MHGFHARVVTREQRAVRCQLVADAVVVGGEGEQFTPKFVPFRQDQIDHHTITTAPSAERPCRTAAGGAVVLAPSAPARCSTTIGASGNLSPPQNHVDSRKHEFKLGPWETARAFGE
jgi:hypothetical protein